MKKSPTASVPLRTSTVATGPRPRSSCASMTVPIAGRLGLALRSCISATSRIISSSSGRFSCVRAETGTMTVSPPQSSASRPRSASCCLMRSGWASGRVDLVDRDDDRHLGRFGVVDGFEGLRHDAVVRRHHQDDDIGDLGAAGAHAGERFVTGGVDEDDLLAVHLHLVRADVLGDAAGFARPRHWLRGWRRAARSYRDRRGP